MALIKSVRGFTPQIGENCYLADNATIIGLADNATIIGDVVMGKDCSVWFNAVLRGDVNSIRIGDRVNIQDGTVLHTLYEKSTVEIGNDVSIGHNVTLHGACVHDNAARQCPDWDGVYPARPCRSRRRSHRGCRCTGTCQYRH